MLTTLRRLTAKTDPVGRAFRVGGVMLASSGFAHFVAPRSFGAISKPVFPDDTGKWVKINGASEAAIGLALMRRQTRVVGIVSSLVYVAYLGDRAVTALTTSTATQ